MKKNKKALSLVIVMWIVLVSSLFILVLLELMLPFSRSVVWMENSAKAYYLANSWLEDSMLILKKDWQQRNQDFFLNWKFWNLNNNQELKKLRTGIFINLKNFSTQEPESGKWNSEFDRDYNKISAWDPIQMTLEWIRDISNLKIFFKIPTINLLDYDLKEQNSIYINWQLSWENGFLNSNNVYRTWWVTRRKYYTIFTPNFFNQDLYIKDFTWLNSKWDYQRFQDAYNQLNCSTKKCILKFSVVRELKAREKKSSTEITLPYLEWKITNWSDDFKKRYADIKSEWKSNWYKRELNIKVQQETVNEAFDFTVIQ